MKTCTSCGKEKDHSEFHKKLNGLAPSCKKCRSLSSKEYSRRNKRKKAEYQKVWKAKNPNYYKEYYWNNRKDRHDYSRWYSALRRANKLRATPVWLTEEQLQEIRKFYWLSQDLRAVSGEIYHVDHIIPLRGKNVCGLHVPWNLQVIPADINLSKGSSLEWANSRGTFS